MTAATLTLTDFLLARIAEDEELTFHGDGGVMDIDGAAFDRTRVWAECEAKRRIVKGFEPFGELDDLFAPEIMGILALPYADHPDYRDEWKP